MDNVRKIWTAPAKTDLKITKKLAPTDSNLLVLSVKAKVEEDMEPYKYDVLQFFNGIEYRYASWLLCKSKQDRDDFMECVNYIWNLLADFEKKDTYFLKIMRTDFDKLNFLQKFYYSYIIFLHVVSNKMIEENIEECLRNLVKANPKQTIFKKLEKFNTYILSWITLQHMDEGLNLDIDYLEETVLGLLPKNEDRLLFEDDDN